MLLGNYSVLNRSPLRYLGGGTATPEVNHAASFYRGGARKNRQYVDQTAAANKRFSLPYGSYPPVMTLLSQTGGDLSARSSGDFALAAAGTGVLGMPGTGTSSITFTVADAFGQLIASGTGAAALTVALTDALLTASVGGTGSSSITIAADPSLLGAIASGVGSSSFTVSFANAQAYPLNDASPLRTGSATITVNGNLTPYATGALAGSTVDNTILTVDAITAALIAAAMASPIHANIKQVNSIAVHGDGQPGTEWGP